MGREHGLCRDSSYVSIQVGLLFLFASCSAAHQFGADPEPPVAVVPAGDPEARGESLLPATPEWSYRWDDTLREGKVPVAVDEAIARHVVRIVGATRCTGTLIAPRLVLTAAHCVHRGGPLRVTFGANPNVLLVVQPEAMQVHPDVRYRKDIDMYENDIALVRLPRQAPEPSTPVRIGWDVPLGPGDELLGVGYGGDATCRRCAGSLRATITNVEALDDGMPRTIRYRSAVGARNASCFGDSGGPLFARAGGELVLVGVRWGADTLDVNEGCLDWGLDGDARDFRDFIAPQLESEFDLP